MKENEYHLLVIKKLSGDLTPAEEVLLEIWINQSPEHARRAQEYELIWARSGNYQKQFSPDLKADFSKVQAKIRAEAAPTLKASRLNFQWWRAAAAVALLAMAIWGYSAFGPASYYDTLAATQQTEKQLVNLSEGSRVWLRKGATLQYAQSYQGKDTRRVKLEGEAYFEVAHDPAHPFKVELAEGGTVEVLGTQFNVRQADGITTILVRSGKVKFTLENGVQSPVLTANQMASFDRKSGKLRISSKTSLNDLSWQTGGLEFVKTPLAQVVQDLEKYYKVKISLLNPEMADCPHTAILANLPLKDVLDGLALTYQLKVEQPIPGEYVLQGGKCY